MNRSTYSTMRYSPQDSGNDDDEDDDDDDEDDNDNDNHDDEDDDEDDDDDDHDDDDGDDDDDDDDDGDDDDDDDDHDDHDDDDDDNDDDNHDEVDDNGDDDDDNDDGTSLVRLHWPQQETAQHHVELYGGDDEESASDPKLVPHQPDQGRHDDATHAISSSGQDLGDGATPMEVVADQTDARHECCTGA